MVPRGPPRSAGLLRRAQDEHLRLLAQGRRLPPREVARPLPGRPVGADQGPHRPGRPAACGVHLRPLSRPVGLLQLRRGCEGARGQVPDHLGHRRAHLRGAARRHQLHELELRRRQGEVGNRRRCGRRRAGVSAEQGQPGVHRHPPRCRAPPDGSHRVLQRGPVPVQGGSLRTAGPGRAGGVDRRRCGRPDHDGRSGRRRPEGVRASDPDLGQLPGERLRDQPAAARPVQRPGEGAAGPTGRDHRQPDDPAVRLEALPLHRRGLRLERRGLRPAHLVGQGAQGVRGRRRADREGPARLRRRQLQLGTQHRQGAGTGRGVRPLLEVR